MDSWQNGMEREEERRKKGIIEGKMRY